MSDRVIARDSGQEFAPHPEGQFVAVCVDVVDLGDRVRDFEGHVSIRPSMALVFVTGQRREDGSLHTISSEFTVSMHVNSKLRPFLEAWRGKPYTQEQVEQGVPIDKLTGVPCLLKVVHTLSRKGRKYAAIMTAVELPQEMKHKIPDTSAYKRAPYWEDRKKAYAAEVAREVGTDMQNEENGYAVEQDDEVPF